MDIPYTVEPRQDTGLFNAKVGISFISTAQARSNIEAETPGWNFAAHVGYSTPEHRAAIAREGVSPLHRMSFQSAAYQQLAL